MGINLR
jgi:hypothetical protein